MIRLSLAQIVWVVFGGGGVDTVFENCRILFGHLFGELVDVEIYELLLIAHNHPGSA